MARILVTGAGGFAGRHVTAALRARGHEVVPARPHDLLEAAGRAALIAARPAEVLIHLAWVTEHREFWSSPLNAAWEVASADLFERFYAAGGRRIVGIGSCAEYDWRGDAKKLREDAPLAPHTAYGAAKVRTCEALMAAAARHGASAAWGRVFFLYGPGEPAGRLIPLMIRAARTGEPLDCGPAAAERDFWDVRNLGAAIAALATGDIEGPVNLASGEATRFDRIGALIEGALGRTGVIRLGRRPLGPGEPMRLVADATRLHREAGFADPVTLTRGLAEYCASA